MEYVFWTIEDLAQVARTRKKNKFDTIICFCGDTGNSKSTGAIKFCQRAGEFKIEKDTVYDRDAFIQAIEDWGRVLLGDEMINTAYKREFYNLDQIEMVKLLNMYRDHLHIIAICIKNFWDLDKPLRDLVDVRVDLQRRGFGVVHKPLSLSYTNDPWDKNNNEKIERSWLEKGGGMKPKWWRLTTFIGFLSYGPLDPRQEAHYQEIKDKGRKDLKEKRDKAKEEKRNPQKAIDPTVQVYERTLALIKEGKLNREDVTKIAITNGIKDATFMSNLNNLLKNAGNTETIWQLLKSQTKQNLINSTSVGIDELGFRTPSISPKEN